MNIKEQQINITDKRDACLKAEVRLQAATSRRVDGWCLASVLPQPRDYCLGLDIMASVL